MTLNQFVGPGKYDDLCTLVCELAQAKGALIIVFDGKLGSGMSCQADLTTTLAIPDMLERAARMIREGL